MKFGREEEDLDSDFIRKCFVPLRKAAPYSVHDFHRDAIPGVPEIDYETFHILDPP